MPQVSCQLSDELHELLIKLAKETGMSKSSLMTDYVRQGIYKDIESQKKVREFLKSSNEES